MARQQRTGSMTLGSMVDDTLWFAALTGGTAVLASWVTSRGNARAAKIQVEASARAQQYSQRREARQKAYLEFIEQAHVTGERYWRLGDVYVQCTCPEDILAGIQQLRNDLRDAFDPLIRCTRPILLEGPAPVAEAAEAVKQSASNANRALWELSEGESGAHERFDEAHRIFRLRLEGFIDGARTATQSPNSRYAHIRLISAQLRAVSS
jgi:hypothetical protein